MESVQSEPTQVTAAELIKLCTSTAYDVKMLKLKNGSGYIVRAFIPIGTNRAPLWVIYGKSIKAIKRILHETREVLGSSRILFIEDYVQDTNLIHDVAVWGLNGLVTCNSWTQTSWGRKAHIGYICGDGYRLSDEAEDILLGVTACLLGNVDDITARICDEAEKVFGQC